MRNVYLDNGATSFPKPNSVAKSMCQYINEIGSNVGRGAYDTSYEAESVMLETRELICELFNFDKVENVIFTKNITESLNVLIKGLLKAEDHVIVSSMEHNAVMRPLNSKGLEAIEVTEVNCDEEGNLDLDDLKRSFKENTKAVIMTHGSNICGTLMPIEEIGEICKAKDVLYIIDTAQTAGVIEIDFKKANADAIAFTGHKSLLGPQGIGGFIINDKLAELVNPLIEGGTGSKSESFNQPSSMPDKFEAGTPNIPGIYGLNASLKYIKELGLEKIYRHEMNLTQEFIDGLIKMSHINVIGKKNCIGRTSVVSIDFPNEDNSLVSYVLNKEYGIKTRCGLHCAPSAHKTLKTFPKGTVRFSFGHFNTSEEVQYTLKALEKCVDL